MAPKKAVEKKCHTKKENPPRHAFINVDQVRKSDKICSRCNRTMGQGEKFLFLERHRHTFLVCGPCLVIAATEVMENNPMAKADAMVEILGDA
jgi:hypothetical protein